MPNTSKWSWCMDYCKRNGLPPAQKYAWDKASEEYDKMMEGKKQDNTDYYLEQAHNEYT